MKYICDKIIFNMKYENCIHTSKLGLWMEFFNEFFCGHYYWYTSIESRAIWKFKIFGWKFIKNMCFFHFSTIKAKCFMYFFKPILNERERDFIVSIALFFQICFYNNVLWTTNMKPYGWQKTAHYICCVH
jgi:hypothetical protein